MKLLKKHIKNEKERRNIRNLYDRNEEVDVTIYYNENGKNKVFKVEKTTGCGRAHLLMCGGVSFYTKDTWQTGSICFIPPLGKGEHNIKVTIKTKKETYSKDFKYIDHNKRYDVANRIIAFISDFQMPDWIKEKIAEQMKKKQNEL